MSEQAPRTQKLPRKSTQGHADQVREFLKKNDFTTGDQPGSPIQVRSAGPRMVRVIVHREPLAETDLGRAVGETLRRFPNSKVSRDWTSDQSRRDVYLVARVGTS